MIIATGIVPDRRREILCARHLIAAIFAAAAVHADGAAPVLMPLLLLLISTRAQQVAATPRLFERHVTVMLRVFFVFSHYAWRYTSAIPLIDMMSSCALRTYEPKREITRRRRKRRD